MIAQRFTIFQRGFSMIEVLVALLVLGVGVMGYAALQLKSVQFSEESYSRGQAMSVAQDFIERVRANKGDSSIAIYTDAQFWEGSNPAGTKTCTITTSVPSAADRCSEQEIARADIFQARRSAEQLLQNGGIQLAECGEVYCVTLAWNETSAEDCDQGLVSEGKRDKDAHCVVIEFVP